MSDYGYEEILSTAPTGQTVHCCLPLPHPDRQIRVLVLDPVESECPEFDEILHGRIDVLNELAHHEYAALSYVWNSKEDPPVPARQNRLNIQCGGHRHETRIKPNCWSALWHLCKIQRPSATILWVDSICIDQNNKEEQNQQISIMCNIYKSAHKTFFWLGEAAEGTDEAMNFLSRDRMTLSEGGSRNTFLIGLRIWWQLMKLEPYMHIDGLRQIFRREWIKRLWTLQEFLLSREGIIVCGEKSISWKRLVCALESINYFHNHPWALHFDSSYLPWFNLTKLAQWFTEIDGSPLNQISENFDQPFPHMQVKAHLESLKWAVRSRFISYLLYIILCFLLLPLIGLCYFMLFYILPQGPNKAKLFFSRTSHSILEELRNRKVSDPKDVYNGTVGILGGNASSTGESLYSVHRRLCISMISKTQSLDVLLFANTYADDNYPSWVINWESEIAHIWGYAIYYMDKRRSTSIRPSEGWNIESAVPTSGLVFRAQFGPAREYIFRKIFFLKQEQLRNYQGAIPGTQPRWNFRDQGQSIRVYGLILTHISSHLTPTSHADAVTPLHPLLRVVLSIKTRANFRLSEAVRILQKAFIWWSQTTTEHSIQMVRRRDTMPTTEATLSQVERRQFISILLTAFTRMTKQDQKLAEKQLTALMIVATSERRLDHELEIWWRTLRGAAGIIQGREWLEEKVLTDEYMENSFNLVMHILQKAKLSAVGCEASTLLGDFHGGLAFAAAGAQTGDAVALISGISFPLVLRPCGQGRFRLVGPIFLPGVMDGELESEVKRVAFDEIVTV